MLRLLLTIYLPVILISCALPLTAAAQSASFLTDQTETGAGAQTENPPAAAAENAIRDDLFNTLHPSIQDQILNEVATVQADCDRKMNYRYFHNCECLATKFFDERLKRGPDAERALILNDIGKTECINQPGIAGHSYDYCMNTLGLLAPQTRRLNDEELDEHCQCFAKTMARNYARAPNPNHRYISSLRIEAMRTCRETGYNSGAP